MKNILFFDVDGTLYNSEKKIPDSAKKAIQKAKENGYEIAIATGRAPFMIESLLEELEINTYVTFNGQYVVYNGEVVFTDSVDKNYLAKIIEFGNERNHPVVFIDEREMIASIDGHDFIQSSLDTLKYPYPTINPLFYEENSVYQTLIFMEEKDEQLYQNTFPEVKFVRWHQFSCDILPKEGSKARGIMKLLERMNIPIENSFAFGDGLNDIEMLQAVGTGVAMGNGHELAKKSADVIAGHVDDDGLAKIMKDLNII
ncbi:Cof-type HAD-IIB family hydrolase [Lysinibacillus endophyticus]|uniref:Cof-type HAD-IIB family hydrolase n=1 Tax=Ureibacillus endophyticus TaxID=1978490 RepID=A0A494Z582_9BACL|nr:Cof-type HAD-IIB family hydrolase [Lysinibacillus endophyticus]MCP1143880.1 Cof-type HAD-IIB family hydrolase [Lysinibacillus endophyticus]RKQ17706.1 Cof-type HAD-IIB family hydrolase [Lysinibacillus endophyticus]